jgi:hypothetical protein
VTDAPDDPVTEPAPQPKPAELRAVDPRLLDLLVCPLTKTTLHYDAIRQELVSRAARLAFPIVDGIPVMVVSEARELDKPPPAGGN